jgi:methionyl-tRNA synthetase
MSVDPAVVVLSPPPTPNGPLHLGHLSGPYIAADIAVRALRERGRSVFAVCGLDDHQNYVLAKARELDEPVREVRDRYAGLIRGVLAKARVVPDEFTEPADDPFYREAVRRFFEVLVTTGAVAVEPWSLPGCPVCPGTLHHAYVAGRCPSCGAGAGGGTCEGCAAYTPADVLVDPICTRCGEPAVAITTVTGPVLRLENHRTALLSFWARATIPVRVRAAIGRMLARPLPAVPLSYPTDWGITSPTDPAHRIDVWAEMGLGYLYTVGRRFAPDAADLAGHVAGWRSVGEVWSFLGLDNAFYYAVLFPALFDAVGVPLDVLGGLVVNEFYRLAGAKFSTSRNHAVWAHELLAEEDPAAVRLFLCWDRPAPFATDFTMKHYRASVAAWSRGAGSHATAEANLARAAEALTPAHFDPALAARCLLDVPAGDRTALLGALTGGAPVPAGV